MYISALNSLSTEATELRAVISDRRTRVSGLTEEIDQITQVALKASERDYEAYSDLRFEIRQKLSTYFRLNDLTTRYDTIKSALSSIGTARRVATDLPSASLVAFTSEFEALLQAWKYPYEGAITFDTKSEDFTLGTRRRREQGKGSRALTYAAFTISLMRYCAANSLQHPGLVVLDSPLVTFRDKDAGTSGIDALSGEAQLQVKDEFYRDLASRVAEQQLIIFENEEPDISIHKDIVFHHFTGDPALPRCGFFPVPSKSEDSP